MDRLCYSALAGERGCALRRAQVVVGRVRSRARVREPKGEACLLLLRLVGEEDGVDVGEDTTLGDRDVLEQHVELLIVADGELDVARVDARTTVVAGSVASELEDLSREVLEDSSEVDRSTRADALAVAALLEEPMDTANRELKPGARGARARLGLACGRGDDGEWRRRKEMG